MREAWSKVKYLIDAAEAVRLISVITTMIAMRFIIIAVLIVLFISAAKLQKLLHIAIKKRVARAY